MRRRFYCHQGSKLPDSLTHLLTSPSGKGTRWLRDSTPTTWQYQVAFSKYKSNMRLKKTVGSETILQNHISCGFKSRDTLSANPLTDFYTCHTTCCSVVSHMPQVSSVSQLGGLALARSSWSMGLSISSVGKGPYATIGQQHMWSCRYRSVTALKNWIAFIDWICLISSILECSGRNLRRKGIGRNSGILPCAKTFSGVLYASLHLPRRAL